MHRPAIRVSYCLQKFFESGYTAERATIAKTYETILDDLKTALDNLPETSKVVTAGHIDYWGARALRARAYLYMNENSKALEDAKYVIEKISIQAVHQR